MQTKKQYKYYRKGATLNYLMFTDNYSDDFDIIGKWED